MEYEQFSASKLPVSYKASIMKRVNEIKRLTSQRRLHVALISRTSDKCTDVTCDGQMLMTSVDDPGPFIYVSSSPVDITSDNDAVTIVPDTHCDTNSIASSFSAHESNLPDKCGDIIKLDDEQELHSNAPSSFVSDSVVSDRSAEFVDDCNCQKDDLHDTCNTLNHVYPSHYVNHLSAVLVKSEPITTDIVPDAASNKLLKKKSVRISSSPPTIRYTNWRHEEVYNGHSNGIAKVSQVLFCLVALDKHLVILS